MAQSDVTVVAAERSDVWKWFKKFKFKARGVWCASRYWPIMAVRLIYVEGLHPLDYKKTPSKRQDAAGTTGSILSDTVCSDSRAKIITNLITDMIALDMRPVRLVEGKGFCSLIHFFDTIPSRKHFTAMIVHQHVLGMEKLKQKLEQEAVGVSLTTDIWTSMATEAYMTVTVHYVAQTGFFKNYSRLS